MEDKNYMQRAIELAKKGAGFVNPNPMVGAVIVKDGKVIGEGYHEKFGGLHAERNALKDCKAKGNSPSGATLYVTLEPCCHYGKTPPCTEVTRSLSVAATCSCATVALCPATPTWYGSTARCGVFIETQRARATPTR